MLLGRILFDLLSLYLVSMMRREIKCGNVKIGGSNSISIQSMLNVPIVKREPALKQCLDLKNVGCEIIRVAIPDMESADAISYLKENIDIPLVADIHFDYRLAVASMERGIDKVRINPGNIGSQENIKKVVSAAKERNIPIRVGVNSGSIEKEFRHLPKEVALVKSALKHVEILEKLNFNDIVVSMKSSDIRDTLYSYEKLNELRDYPLHIGITESGINEKGIIKSSIGIGALLLRDLGDTIRVSLTGDPVEEIKVARDILSSLGLRKDTFDLVSCPTCGRTKVELSKIASEVESRFRAEKIQGVKVAVMGCVVNGPGEAGDADLGVACGDGKGTIFLNGRILETVPENQISSRLIELAKELG